MGLANLRFKVPLDCQHHDAEGCEAKPGHERGLRVQGRVGGDGERGHGEQGASGDAAPGKGPHQGPFINRELPTMQ